MDNFDFDKMFDMIFASNGIENKKDDNQELDKASTGLKELFDSMLRAGFTEKQAISLMVGLLGSMLESGNN